MQEPTAEMVGSAFGDYVGITWLLRDVEGVRLVGHGGITIGQFSAFVMVPSRGFAFVALTNSGPNGYLCHDDLLRWALRHYLGLDDPVPRPIKAVPQRLAQFVGRYETIGEVYDVAVEGDRLRANVTIKPEMAAVLREAGEEVEAELTDPDRPRLGGQRSLCRAGGSSSADGRLLRSK